MIRRILCIGFIFVLSTCSGGLAQVWVQGSFQAGNPPTTTPDYHSFMEHNTFEPISGEVVGLGDVLIQYDLEVGDRICFANQPNYQGYIEGITSSPDRLEIATTNRISPEEEPEVWINSTAGVVFVADSDGDTNTLPFRWYNNGTDSTDKLADLGGFGTLRIKGTLVENSSFDLAEAFLRRDSLEPGNVVSIDPDNPKAAVLSVNEEDRRVIGVVSEKPGIVLGGGAFGINELQANWGSEAVEMFESMRNELRTSVIEESAILKMRQQKLVSRNEPSVDEDGGESTLAREADEARLEADLESEMLRTFFEKQFVSVALAGRIPVKVDAAFGPIRPGDLLAPSPIAGVAMKAKIPGAIVGTALEPLPAGSGKVMSLIHRGWYGGESMDLAARQSIFAEKNRQIEDLTRRLRKLESIVDQIARVAGVEKQGKTIASVKH